MTLGILTLFNAAAAPSPVALPAGPGSLAPHLLDTPAGLRLTWLEPREEGHALRTSVQKSKTWSTPVSVVESAELVANWADTPNAVIAGDGALVVSYPRKSGEGTYAYDVVLARSEDGKLWADLGSPHDDGTETEHGFTSFVAEGNGFRTFWLDGRMTADGGPMTLRTSVWDGAFSGGSIVDERVCDCCGTAATVTPAGWMAVYRDRSDAEIRDTRAATAAGSTAVGIDGWQMPGCPVNGPRVVNTPAGQLVAWTTGAGGKMEVRAAASTKGGFGPSQVLAPASDGPVGRVDLVAHDTGIYATWLGAEGVWAQRLESGDGKVSGGPAVKLAKAAASRSTGFPRAAIRNERLVVVWTGEKGLTATQLDLADLAGAVTVLPEVATAAPVALDKRPELTGETLTGEAWALQSTRGPVLVALWASWCGPCRAELPALQKLADEHPDLALVVVAVDDDAAAVTRAAPERPGTWVTATRKDVESAFRTSAIPASWLFAEDGHVAWSVAGALDSDAAGAAFQKAR